MGEGLFQLRRSQMADVASRPNRAEETRRARRMKPGDTVDLGLKLSLDRSNLDPNKDYRWVRDTPSRVDELKRKDWDIVSAEDVKKDGTGVGTVPTAHGGVDEAGKPYGMVLMGKYKDWIENDKKRKSGRLAETDAAIRKGTAHQASGEADLSGASYTPGTNTIDTPKGIDIR
jgi:hypothetical protein